MRIPQSKRPGTGVEGLELPNGSLPLRWRVRLVMAALVLGAVGLLGKAVHLQMNQGDYLRDQGTARHVRTVNSHAPRGEIRDRHGTVLAMSTAIESIWADPREADPRETDGVWERWSELAAAIGSEPSEVERKLLKGANRSFVYLRRHVKPETAARVRALALPGVYFEREFRRYYPESEVIAHVVGFTDIDGKGREGVEYAYDRVLRGVSGAKQIIQDRLGRSVEDVQNVRSARPGREVSLTLDLRLQLLAYRALKAAVRNHRAAAGSVVVVDARTGEIHAMVNQPSYNPNAPEQRTGPATRNRAVTDMFEPGSTVKPFAVTAALESGAFRPRTVVDTSPGRLRIGRNVVRDRRDLGELDVTGVIRLSSNVGVTHIALATPPEQLWDVYTGAGFGSPSGSRAVGESSGVLKRSPRFGDFERATLSYGYGLAVTALQLARAYTVFANEGKRVDVRMDLGGERDGARGGGPQPVTQPVTRRVMSGETARAMLAMLEAVVETQDGTGRRARIRGYRVAGKTGTTRKAIAGGYAERRYLSLFAGLAPVGDPRFVVTVVIDDPRGDKYYGGEVAAPVFQSVMSDALRLNAVPPDSVATPPRDAAAENYALVHQDSR